MEKFSLMQSFSATSKDCVLQSFYTCVHMPEYFYVSHVQGQALTMKYLCENLKFLQNLNIAPSEHLLYHRL